MKKFWKNYRLTIPAFTIIAGVILHLVIPGIIALIIGFLFSLLMMGDPIYGQERTKEVWTEICQSVGLFLYIQGRHAFISSALFGIATGLLVDRIKPQWKYPVVIGFALGLHFVFSAIFTASYYVFSSREIRYNILIYNFITVTIVAPILALIAIFLKKRSDRSDETGTRGLVQGQVVRGFPH